MFFGLSEQQALIRDSFRSTLGRISDVGQVRKTIEARMPVDDEMWRELCELGIAGIVIPQEYGGSGLGLFESAVIAEELGRRVCPVPFVASAVMGPLALRMAGSPAQISEWLPRLASGERRLGVAVAETAAGRREDAGVTASGGRLDGRALFVLDAAGSDAFIVGDLAGDLHLVTGDTPGLSQTPLESIDRTRSIAELQFENCRAEALTAGTNALARVIQAGRIVLAADSLGASEIMLEKAVAYTAERKQFGQAIGSFQAVKHLCAEMAAELQPCRSLVWYAAYTYDNEPEEAALAALQGKSHMDVIGGFVARTATEIHGAMGYADITALHYWFKRLGASRVYLGNPERVRAEAASLQGLPIS